MSTSISVSRTVPAPPARVFALLTDPARHLELDTSGMVRAALSTEPLTAAGQVFVMDMHNERRGDYRTANSVIAFERDAVIGWAPAVVGQAPLGHTYVYRLAASDGGTEVTLTYDWSEMTDPVILPLMPRVTAEQLRETLDRIAALVA